MAYKPAMSKSLYEENLALLEVSGKDARDFLHRLTSQDFKNFQEGESKNAALLKANSQIHFLFTATLKNGVFSLAIEKAYVEGLHQELEKMHFAEDLSFKISESLTQPPKLSETERVEKGLWIFNVDISDKNLILEAPAASYFHRDKGCYPGQEVVERVFTYGQVAKKLVGIKLKNFDLKVGDALTVDDKAVGKITSVGRTVALAMVHKSHYSTGSETDQGQVFALGDS